MVDYTSVISTAGQAKIANAIAGGPTITINAVAVGDGGGAPMTPSENDTALRREVWRGAPSLVTRDAAYPTQMIVEATIPVAAGPFTIREAALITDDGKLFAICSYPATDKPTAAQGAVSDITLQFVVVVDTAAAVSVVIDPTTQVQAHRLSRLPFISVNSASLTIAPSSPAVGDLYIVPAGAAGVWATAAVGQVAEWTGSLWAFMTPPKKMIAGIMDKADGSVSEFLKWNGTAWVTFGTAGDVLFVQDSGTADQILGNTLPSVAALRAGQVVLVMKAAADNATTTPQAKLNGWANLPLVRRDGTALVAGDLPASSLLMFSYDGTNLRLLGQAKSDALALIATTAPTGAVVGNGWWRDPVTGFTVQWGSGITTNGTQTVTYPRAFTSFYACNATDNGATSWSTTNATFLGIGNGSNTGFLAQSVNWNGSAFIRTTAYFGWIAIGKS